MRITYSKFGKRMGRLGNSIMQLCTLYGMSRRYNRELVLPEWEYQKYFKYQIPITAKRDSSKDIGEPCYEFAEWNYWDNKEKNAGELMSISGWLQSYKYWEEYREEIRNKLLEFDEEYKAKVYNKFKHIFENGKQTILIGIRVGDDYLKNGNYEMLPILYQVSALYKYFPDWVKNYNVLIFSDNFQYAKLNLDCYENIYFAEGLNDIGQLCLGTFCDHFIIPNSTFSVCQVILGQKEGSVIVRPSKYFKGYLEKNHSTRDFWEEGWIEHDYRGEKIDLKDVTFCIPVKYDHEDRAENLNLVIKWLNSNFNTNIFVGEQGGNNMWKTTNGWHNYTEFNDMKVFHRTQMLNRMFSMFAAPIDINFDCDNICPILQIAIGVEMLRNKEADCVYPYDGRVARVGRQKWLKTLLETNGDCGVFGGEVFRGTRSIDPLSVGHIIMFNKEKFFECGGENENFISYGPEDVERWERFNKLMNVKRLKGIVYHIDHYCGPDSSGSNPYFGKNYNELERIRKMNKDQLIKEVRSWEWVKTKKEAF